MCLLAGNNIGDYGASSLAQALKINASITTLYLSGMYIKPISNVQVHFSFSEFFLTHMCILAGNNIGDHGASSLAEALKINASITTLNLWSMYIRLY